MSRLQFYMMLILLGLSVGSAAQPRQIVTTTSNSALIFTVGEDGRLYQSYFGARIDHKTLNTLKQSRHQAYIPAGMDDLFEPAIQLVHADGNPSLELRYQGHKSSKSGNITKTLIELKDPKYPVKVDLHIESYEREDIIRYWTEIKHQEGRALELSRYASSMLHFDATRYWLTQFHGDWASEMKQDEKELSRGIKIIDSKLGTRAQMYQTPVFMVSLNKASTEISGELIGGTLEWTGNFQFVFEVDERNSLRLISGINPYASTYHLQPGEVFKTPAFTFTYSNQGKEKVSQNFHNWARNYGVLDGKGDRLTLLNNWEATYFDFNEEKLKQLFSGAANLGVDMFLLDDGWFANKYPRNDDKAGLGDWQENKQKLPNGLGYLVKEAEKQGVKFGIWLEPEMLNPKSELYEQHPDWILKLPNRQEHYFRNQLVLDLINPQVQDFMYNLVNDMLQKNPSIAYIKWDCNRMLTNAYSPYLKDKQSHLYIEYVRSLYKVLERIRTKYPMLPMMLCAGGGGRTDYGALRYFTEFWPSDNTDGLERIYIQYGYSYFYPAKVLSSHVTSWGKQSLKFRTDVAMMGKLGYDIDLAHLTPDELSFSRNAVKTYQGLSKVIWEGSLYRLVSPYEENRAVLMYSDQEQREAVLFSYNLHTRYAEPFTKVRLRGLDPKKSYRVEEVNLLPGTVSKYPDNGRKYTGSYLMNEGLDLINNTALTSAVFHLKEDK